MLDILNRQRKVPFDVAAVRPRLEAAMAAAGAAGREVSLALLSDAAMRRLNRDWRFVDRPTDCLSFPAAEGEDGDLAGDVLGDVAISLETARRQGLDHAAPGTADDRALADEVVVLFVHSLLHLMGHDHEDDADHEKMVAREQEILAAIADRRESEVGSRK
jgi:probable rRNA maturation factor